MVILFVLGLLLGALTVVFVLQNIAVITVSFFAWQVEGSLAVILMLAVIAGAMITLLLLLPEGLKNYFSFRRLKKENAKLEEELRKQKELTVFAKTPPPTAEALRQIEEL